MLTGSISAKAVASVRVGRGDVVDCATGNSSVISVITLLTGHVPEASVRDVIRCPMPKAPSIQPVESCSE